MNLNLQLKQQKVLQLPARDRLKKLMASRMGRYLTRSWFDYTTLWWLTKFYLPLSRSWAAAALSEGSIGHFKSELSLTGPIRGIEKIINQVATFQSEYRAIQRRWEYNFFDVHEKTHTIDQEDLIQSELMRRKISHQFMVEGRKLFSSFWLKYKIPAVRFMIPDQTRMDAKYGSFLTRPQEAYQLPDEFPIVQESSRVNSFYGKEYWLRFSSSLGETAWAHVFEPENADANTPTFIYSHGLFVELELLDLSDEPEIECVQQGIRVIRLESLGHGRRRVEGWYGGETFLAKLPMSALDFLTTQVREIATLINWVRNKGTCRLAVGGTSLGALVSQMVVAQSKYWPEKLKPDILYLSAGCLDTISLIHRSSLSRKLNISDIMLAKKWTTETLSRYKILMEPTEPLPLGNQNIIMILGEYDTVTPYSIALKQVKDWNIPEENLFIRKHGHFTLPLSLSSNNAPIKFLADKLKQ
ncbi:MAG: hypothetical protein K1X44_06670 [Alphaproteobacteria bacterium]|nr:hypothetical protein [Alphaproteobacteria bacterium]